MTTNKFDTLDDLDISAAPEAYKFKLSTGEVITFPDPGEMNWESAERLMGAISDGSSFKKLISIWLTPEDFKALSAANLTLRQMMALAERVSKHYEAIFGGPGEG